MTYSYYSSFDTYRPSPFAYIISICIIVLLIISFWGIFQKAGEAGWKSIIPLYNSYIEYKITWGNGWYFLLLLIPIVNIVIGIMTTYKLAVAFGKGVGFTFGLIFLPIIFYPMLAFGSARYQGVR